MYGRSLAHTLAALQTLEEWVCGSLKCSVQYRVVLVERATRTSKNGTAEGRSLSVAGAGSGAGAGLEDGGLI